MDRSISGMIGKGSVSHNKRKFFADNVDRDRTANNITFIDENLREVYHMLFDEALKKYNEKQTRNDRKIPDYYEKIRTGKQEKLFTEVIFQIGNKDDMNARDENGEMAKKILCEFMNDFQNRNPYLRVFSAHLHMDEETPHLHIDFVPFSTGSKRGLETRVSLKKALALQGFKGGSKSETERSQWILSEKQELSHVMERHNVFWKQLDLHKPHLSLLDYKKQERTKEVEKITDELTNIQNDLGYFEVTVDEYYSDKQWQLQPPKPLMSGKEYKEKVAMPLVNKLKNAIRFLVLECLKIKREYRTLKNELAELKKDNVKPTGTDDNSREFEYINKALQQYLKGKKSNSKHIERQR